VVRELRVNRDSGAERRRFLKKGAKLAGLLGASYFLSRLPLAYASEASFARNVAEQVGGAGRITIGPAVVTPTIDGVWQSGEWDDATELKLSLYQTSTPNGEAYLRFKYDSSKFYGLVDVPSDDGSTFTQNGKTYHGAAAIGFGTDDQQIDLTTNDPDGFTFSIGYDPNGKFGVYNLKNAQNLLNDVEAAAELGASPHSTNPHRIWEYSIKIGDVVRSFTPKDTDGSPLVRFFSFVSDSSNNLLNIRGEATGNVELKFGPTSLPEEISPALPLALTSAVLYLFARSASRRPASA
jgi:hypothetical protein